MKPSTFAGRDVVLPLFVILLATHALIACDGKARDLTKGTLLGPSVIGDDESRDDGVDYGQIYTITNIVEATSDIPDWTNADLPFTGPRRQLGQSAADSQWPFQFIYSYPTNNYKMNEARVVIVTARDNSDTEGIFVDGVMTGRPPESMVSAVSTKILHRYYSCAACAGAKAPSMPTNTYFMDWALTHYKIGTPNSFDLNLTNLLVPTTLSIVDIINDGILNVVTGDDALVREDSATTSRPLLFLEGFTVSKDELTCVDSPSYKFINTYIHNDGNSIGQAAFSGSVSTPSQSWSAANNSFRSVEFYYDPRLPKISDLTRIDFSKVDLRMQVRRESAGAAAIVINGIGISETGFDRTTAEIEGVEEWDETVATGAAWSAFLTAIPANSSSQVVTLNLLTLLGEDRVRTLLAQGKLNVSIAGGLASVYGQGATSTRTYGVSVNGPELILEGSYNTSICEVPDNPSSPLSDSSGEVGSCDLDGTSPVLSSIQVVNVTSTSATLQWLSNENADSQVAYGVSAPSTDTTLDTNMTAFHSVQLTGLQPYKFYQYVVKSKDQCDNATTSSTRSFRTLR